MKTILQYCTNLPLQAFEAGEVLLEEGGSTHQIFILKEGAIEVYRGDEIIAIIGEPGSVFGEMSVLLNCPHTANVRTAASSSLYRVDGALEFLHDNPDILLPITRLLASRLRNSTTYLLDIKKQFKDQSDHFSMVDAVLESLSHEQDAVFTPDEELPPDP
ncbi:MAG: Crp/Fnr family transcriptional regulator [Rhizobiaceae bacterium]